MSTNRDQSKHGLNDGRVQEMVPVKAQVSLAYCNENSFPPLLKQTSIVCKFTNSTIRGPPDVKFQRMFDIPKTS